MKDWKEGVEEREGWRKRERERDREREREERKWWDREPYRCLVYILSQSSLMIALQVRPCTTTHPSTGAEIIIGDNDHLGG